MKQLIRSLKPRNLFLLFIAAVLSFSCNKEKNSSAPAAVSLPVLSTLDASSITSAGAVSGGNISSDGGDGVSFRGVCWNTAPGALFTDTHTADGTGMGSYGSTITGLNPSTTYYLRSYATNSAGTAYGNEVVFTTLPAPLDPIVLTVGAEYLGGRYVARLWINNHSGSTIDITSSNAGANSIYVDGGVGADTYTAGYENQGGVDYAMVWKNNIGTYLTNGLGNAIANAVFVVGNDVYAAGIDNIGGNDIATFWKNGVGTALTNGTYRAAANAICVSGTDVYVGGYEMSAAGFLEAKIWKNGTGTSLTNGINNDNAAINALTVSGTDVYAAGYESTGAGSHEIAKLWKNGVATSFTAGTTDAFASSLFVTGPDVYVTGWEDGPAHQTAQLWKNGALSSLTNGSLSTYGKSVFVKGSDVYVAGFESDGLVKTAKFWKNGVGTALTDGTHDSYATSIWVVQ